MKDESFFSQLFFHVAILIVSTFLFSHSWAQTSPKLLQIGPFSTAQVGGPLPNGWTALTFEKIPVHTQYSLTRDEGIVVIKALSYQSSSGLTKKINLDPKQYPVIQWRWKIENILSKGDVTKKGGDDYPARIYITFGYDSSKVGFFEKAKFELFKLAYGEYPPVSAINYIWESRAPIGTVVPNPYTDHVRMIVIESGSQKMRRWVTEERNVYEDYKMAFGEEPPNISGIAIMTDTDNTGESAISYFGDITMKTSEGS